MIRPVQVSAEISASVYSLEFSPNSVALMVDLGKVHEEEERSIACFSRSRNRYESPLWRLPVKVPLVANVAGLMCAWCSRRSFENGILDATFLYNPARK